MFFFNKKLKNIKSLILTTASTDKTEEEIFIDSRQVTVDEFYKTLLNKNHPLFPYGCYFDMHIRLLKTENV